MISKFSVKKPYTVLVGVVLAIVLGVVSFTRMTTDLLPSISLPYVIVMTTYAGANPETVETVVTQPVEAGMATISNVESIRSVSAENYSMVIMEFAQSTNMDSVSLEIRETLDQIKSYWDDSVGSPIIMKLNPDMLPIMIAAVGVDGMDAAQVSTYVQDSVMPDLESIEGVASVSATGLLEESVNVIIRQELIDELNKKVFAAIDDKMKDAEQELADGRQTLEDSKKELEDGKKELSNGRKEITDGKQKLEDGKKELEDGKSELNSKKNDTLGQLAATKQQLLTAKTQLESAKMTMNTNLTTAKQLEKSIAPLNSERQFIARHGSTLHEDYKTAYLSYWDPVSGGNAESRDAYGKQIDSLKESVTNSTVLAQAAEMDTSGMMKGMLANLAGLDWKSSDPKVFQTVYGSLMALTQALSNPMVASTLDAQIEKLQTSLDSLTNGLGAEQYEAMVVKPALKTFDKNLKKINDGLVEVEKGELTAAIEFANANAQIALGEYQMELSKSQLDSAEEQLKTAEDQMKDGQDQLKDAEAKIKDGEEQLEEAREDAYKQADMSGVLTVDTVKGLLSAQNFSMPAGYVTEEGVEYLVRVGDKPETVEELRAMPLMDLHMDGVPVVCLGDVADVFYTDNSGEIYTNVNGSPGVMLTMQKQTGYSTGDVSDKLGKRFKELMKEHEGLSILTLMDQGIYIDLVMDSIINNILFGGVLAILILILFLRDFRPTLVIAFSIPISLVTAIVCMYFSGVTLNVISLSGLALGIGMLVDNSIVVIENIYRLRGEGMSMAEAAVEGAREVAGAIMASTLTTICVFLPIVFTEGITRQLFVDMGLTIAYSLVASLVIALTVVPAMASKVLTDTKEQKQSRFFGKMLDLYEKLLRGALKVKSLVYILVIVLLVSFVALAFSRGTAFMPEMDSTELTVSVELAKDATLEETGAVTDQVVEAILSIDDIQDVGAMTASSTMSLLGGASSGGSTNATSIYVVAREDKKLSNQEIAALIQEKTAHLDAEITVETSTMDMSAMGGSGISIQVQGRDLDRLADIARDVAAVLETVEGTADISDGLGESDEELRVLIDREKAVNYGLTVAQVYSQIYAKLAAANTATVLVAADKDYNVYVRHSADMALTRELVRDIAISGTDRDGKKVDIALSEIADFEDALSLKSINRMDQTRYVSVTAAIADGYNVGLVSNDVQRAMRGYKVPAGYKLVYSGENETINDAMRQVGLMLVLALIFMYLIMVAQFQSLLSPFIIMFTIPLAFTGGFAGLYLTGSEVSVIAMIGFVMLSGVIVNNGIVIIDYMNQLRESGMEKREAIVTAGRTRMRPVLMTALTTILALSTMVFSNDMGADMSKPMAVVTIGGLLYGTLLTLVVIPCVYDNFTRDGKRGKRVKEKKEK